MLRAKPHFASSGGAQIRSSFIYLDLTKRPQCGKRRKCRLADGATGGLQGGSISIVMRELVGISLVRPGDLDALPLPFFYGPLIIIRHQGETSRLQVWEDVFKTVRILTQLLNRHHQLIRVPAYYVLLCSILLTGGDQGPSNSAS